jgi:anti-repressor protein
MTELIKVHITAKGNQAVDARELHKFLEVGRRFNDWIKDVLSIHGFKENIEYAKLAYDIHGKVIGRPLLKKEYSDNQAVTVYKTEYILTLDCAKHICLLQRNEKGRQARDYFIQCEKKLWESKTKTDNPPSYAVALRKWADEVEAREVLEQKVKTLEPLALMAETVLASDKEINMREVAGVINIKGLGRNKLFKLLREKKVLSEDNLPYRIYIDRGYFRVIEVIVGEKLIVSTHVTQKGLQYILKLIEKETPV